MGARQIYFAAWVGKVWQKAGDKNKEGRKEGGEKMQALGCLRSPAIEPGTSCMLGKGQ